MHSCEHIKLCSLTADQYHSRSQTSLMCGPPLLTLLKNLLTSIAGGILVLSGHAPFKTCGLQLTWCKIHVLSLEQRQRWCGHVCNESWWCRPH